MERRSSGEYRETNVRKFATALAFVAAAALTAPAQAQQSDSYKFLKAVKEGDAVVVQDMASAPTAHVTINSKERGTGDTALHLLARERNLGWASFLIGKGAKPDVQNEEGNTPLAVAAQLGWLDGAQLLLAKQANVDLANKRGETPLILAVQRRDLPMVQLLLSQGADPKKQDNVAGYSALDYARRDARSAAIIKLLEAPPKRAKQAQGPVL